MFIQKKKNFLSVELKKLILHGHPKMIIKNKIKIYSCDEISVALTQKSAAERNFKTEN